MLNSILKELGLTENEIKIYISLLDLGEVTSGEIIAKAGIKTGRVYDIFNSLKEKGLISEIIKDGAKHFSACEPSRILNIIEKKKEQLSEQEKQIKSEIPQILARLNYSKSPTRIEIYTGFEGMKTAYLKETEHYAKGKELLVMGVAYFEHYTKETTNFFYNQIYPARERARLSVRKISDISARKSPTEEKKSKNVNLRYLDYPSVTSINIIDNYIIMGLFTSEQIYITIESEEIAKNFRTQFEFLWKSAKP